MPSDFSSILSASIAEGQAPSAPATSEPVGQPEPEAQGAEEAEQAPEDTGEPAPQQEEQEQPEEADEQGAEEDTQGRGDLNKALASERYKARAAKEALRDAQAEVAALRQQAAHLAQLQAQVQELQAAKAQASQMSAQQEAQQRAQALLEAGDVEGAAHVWQQFAVDQAAQAKADADARAKAAADAAQHQQLMANLTIEGSRLMAQYGQEYSDTMKWFGEDPKAAPVAQTLGLGLLDGTTTPAQVFEVASALRRGMASSDAAIEAEVKRRLAAAQVNGPQAQNRSPRLSGLPGGTGNTSQTPAHTGNPQALQQVERGTGFGAYLGAALQA